MPAFIDTLISTEVGIDDALLGATKDGMLRVIEEVEHHTRTWQRSGREQPLRSRKYYVVKIATNERLTEGYQNPIICFEKMNKLHREILKGELNV